ncbi:MAG: hypothetical protein RR350_04325 [Oscillibacter sp.]
MNIEILMLAVGLAVLIVVNIILGCVSALFEQAFDKQRLFRGVVKGLIVAVCFGLVYLVGWLNPDVVAVTIDGTAVNLLMAVYMILMAGFLFYAKEVCLKLAAFVKGGVSIEPKEAA